MINIPNYKYILSQNHIKINIKGVVKMEEKKTRRGYKTQAQQNEANKRYLANNPEAKEKIKKSGYKSKAKKFIKEMATVPELEELKEMIKERLK